jgi:hypothetical protein
MRKPKVAFVVFGSSGPRAVALATQSRSNDPECDMLRARASKFDLDVKVLPVLQATDSEDLITILEEAAAK